MRRRRCDSLRMWFMVKALLLLPFVALAFSLFESKREKLVVLMAWLFLLTLMDGDELSSRKAALANRP